jgi:serine-type D-Ala-D-Ala carboxypeptidase (penicillin-binding protein 5/6)
MISFGSTTSPMRIVRGRLALLALIATAGSASALVTIVRPRLTAYHAALLVDADSGRALYQYQADMRWPPASLTKMMLLLVAEKRLKAGRVSLDMPVRISRKAAATGGKRLNLLAGAEYPLGELMRAALVASANDAAVAVAEAIAGSTETCVHLMNEEARQVGLLHTHYATVNGLPSPIGEDQDVTTAHDLASLARYVIYHTNLLDWSREELCLVAHGALVVRNTNELLTEFPGCDGLKTGHTYESGFSLTATAQRRGLRLIVVILGSGRSSERFRQAARLLQWGFDNYETISFAAQKPIH